MTRKTETDRMLALLESGASIEHVIGEAYNAGHSAGSGVRFFTDAENDLLEAVRLLSLYAIDIIDTEASGELARLIRCLLEEDDEKEVQARMTDSCVSSYGISLDDE